MAEFFPKNDPHNQLLQQQHQQQRIDASACGQQYHSDDTDGLHSSTRQHHPPNDLITKKEIKMNLKKEKDKEKEKEKDKIATQKKEKASKQKKEGHSDAGKGSKATVSANPKHATQSHKGQQNNHIVGPLNESEQTAKIKILMKNVVRPLPLPLPPPPHVPPLNPEHRLDSRVDDSRSTLYTTDMRNLLLAANHRADEGTSTGTDRGTGKGAEKALRADPQSSSSPHNYPTPHNELMESSLGDTNANTVTMSETSETETDIAGAAGGLGDPDSEYTGSNCIVNSRSEADFLGELANGEDGGGGGGDGTRTNDQRLLHRECKTESISMPGQPHAHIFLPLPLPLPLNPR